MDFHPAMEMLASRFITRYAYNDSQDFQGPKEVVQDMLLPHEVITTFLETGETERMIGQTVPNLNAFGYGIFLFSKT